MANYISSRPPGENRQFHLPQDLAIGTAESMTLRQFNDEVIGLNRAKPFRIIGSASDTNDTNVARHMTELVGDRVTPKRDAITLKAGDVIYVVTFQGNTAQYARHRVSGK
ncbi:hypothetical protein KSX_62790 [Ktedonospora formicarum]|uniref:Uncharacterized protein n=1 Tax=Ktedonospora formicarum TaxID=2778364 RepID=A0A8J3MVN4_9CHLR|nr:hypothetical protein KSX_62790 [Ktedonospora formicarum]